jgi:hypothetical protein
VARDSRRQLHYTGAHVVRFKIRKLREYEAILRQKPDCPITWAPMNPRGGRLDQPSRVEGLQLADTVASATFAAFEPDQFIPRQAQTEGDILGRVATRLNSGIAVVTPAHFVRNLIESRRGNAGECRR